jgi:putative intracellular protease/amidase
MLLQDLIRVLDPLQVKAKSTHLELSLLAETPNPVSTRPPPGVANNTMGSAWWPQLVPTHTFATAPADIEVLVIPGGPGMRNGAIITAVVAYIRAAYPRLSYLVTVCTGAGLAAKAGVLDSRRATTNKSSWDTVTAMGPNVTWVSPALWVVDGNIWSASGVSGFDDCQAVLTLPYRTVR